METALLGTFENTLGKLGPRTRTSVAREASEDVSAGKRSRPSIPYVFQELPISGNQTGWEFTLRLVETPRHIEATMNDKDLPAEVPEEVALGLALGLGAPLDLARALGVFFATALSGRLLIQK